MHNCNNNYVKFYLLNKFLVKNNIKDERKFIYIICITKKNNKLIQKINLIKFFNFFFNNRIILN